MKQILLVGDLYRWKAEAEFITEMLHLTASRVVTVNTGLRLVPADLNARELRQLFPGKTGEESTAAAIAKFYSQGIADGLLCLVGREPNLEQVYSHVFAAIPFGMPKVAIVAGDSPWRGSKDVIHFFLPGVRHNLNPVIKICLCNAVFAISGMSLCNIHNFGSKMPTVGIAGFKDGPEDKLPGAGLNYLSFEGELEFPGTLIRNGYIHGLFIGNDLEACTPLIQAAAVREIPSVIVSRNPDRVQRALAPLGLPVFAPVVLITPEHRESALFGTRVAAAKPQGDPPPWLKQYSVSHKYGTETFYRYAVKVLTDLLL